VRVSRLRLKDFRGWSELDLRPEGHVVVAGVPRSGRSDVIAALTRLLDPAYIRVQPSLADIRRHRGGGSTRADDASTVDGSAAPTPPEDQPANATTDGSAGGDAADEPVLAPYAEVEVTLADLDAELEQLCDGSVEPLDVDDQIDDSGNAAFDAKLGVRLCYRVTYDPIADGLEHVVYYPARSDPAAGQYARVPGATRRALPVIVLSAQRPLQLRAEGTLRRLVDDRDASGASEAFRALEQSVATATTSLAAHPTISATVDDVLQVGNLSHHLTGTPITAEAVQFQPEDGSLSALLRTVQPALNLDDAGLLGLSNHGSTTTAVLSAAEALLLATTTDRAVVLGDDFGDGLDAATSEHLAASLRAAGAQVWLSTRRPEVARAFAPAELVRLARFGGARTHHRLAAPGDRKEIAVRRLVHTQLLPALTAPVVAIVEGPHDLTTFTAADRHPRAARSTLAAVGVRLVSADNGSGGGTGQIPRVADLARALGFRVVALIDRDPDKTSATVLADIEAACDVVVRLPPKTAIEEALQSGVDAIHLRAAAGVLPAYGIPDPSVGKADGDVSKAVSPVLHKKGLHEQFLDAVIESSGALPPVIEEALATVGRVASAAYGGPRRVDLPAPLGTGGSAVP
jgi:putative ATP-dependent endonuclease of the OLD family